MCHYAKKGQADRLIGETFAEVQKETNERSPRLPQFTVDWVGYIDASCFVLSRLHVSWPGNFTQRILYKSRQRYTVTAVVIS